MPHCISKNQPDNPNTQEIYVGSYRAKYWFDDEGTIEHKYETVPKYETRWRMVVDMPSEPVMHSVEIHKLKNHVAELESHLRYIKSHIPSLEIQLQKEKQDEKDFEQYSAERKALDAKYQNRFNGMS